MIFNRYRDYLNVYPGLKKAWILSWSSLFNSDTASFEKLQQYSKNWFIWDIGQSLVKIIYLKKIRTLPRAVVCDIT